jgi:hypothetical protein
MKRWWTFPVLPAVVFGLGLPSAAPASTHCTVSIIMTTLGTDGTSVSQTITVPPNSSLQIQPGVGTDTPVTASPSNPAGSKPGAGGGSGGGGGGSGANASKTNVPSAATPVPDDSVIPFDPDTGSIPVPSDGSDDEPTPPVPPILVPDVPADDVPTVPDVIDGPIVDDDSPLPPTSEPGGGVAEAPEPGTLTLLGLAAIGSWGYARKKRKA